MCSITGLDALLVVTESQLAQIKTAVRVFLLALALERVQCQEDGGPGLGRQDYA